MEFRASHLRRGLVLSALSIAWTGCRWPAPLRGLPPLAIAKYRVAAHLGSGALRLDSILTAVAAVLAAISLASLAASNVLGLWWADAVAALIVGAILLREGWQSLRVARSEDGGSPTGSGTSP